jgi:hypothetical protein
MDDIWHRLEMNFTRPPDTKDSIGTRVASKIRWNSLRGCALGGNFVETAIGIAIAWLWPLPLHGGRHGGPVVGSTGTLRYDAPQPTLKDRTLDD